MEEKSSPKVQYFSNTGISNQTDLDHLNSLDQFFYNQQPANLNNCDKEPINHINTIQSYGFLIAVDIESNQIVSASENILQLTEFKSGIFNTTLGAILPKTNQSLTHQFGKSQGTHLLLSSVELGSKKYQCIYHEQNTVGFLEFIPETQLNTSKVHENLRLLNNTVNKIMASETAQEAMDTLSEAVHSIIDFSRVKIYKFQPDWSGKVVSEYRLDHMPSYKGLLFPASDIPQQARFMMTLLPFRAITSAQEGNVSNIIFAPSYENLNLDLTYSLLRGVSNMHLAYLRNFNVNASFSVSLLYDDKLWGCIACHDDKEKAIPFDSWGIVNQLAVTLMVKFRQLNAKNNAEIIANVRAIEEEINQHIVKGDDFEKSLENILPELRTFLDSSGIIFQYGSKTYVNGDTPNESFVKELIDWLKQEHQSDLSFSTTTLHKHWPHALDYIENCCGILYEKIQLNQNCHLIWLRGPKTKTENWAGDPHAKNIDTQTDGTESLAPRNSFSKWVSVHKDLSQDWSTADTDAAKEILLRMFKIVSNHLELVQHNKNMKTFSYAAAHDLKTPLRHISFAMKTITNENHNLQNSTIEKMSLEAQKSVERLSQSLDSMLNFLVVEQQQINFLPVNLNEVIDESWSILNPDRMDTVSIENKTTTNLFGNKHLLITLFQNLLGNSIKFKQPSIPLKITISTSETLESILINVTDNGMGIKMSDKSDIFKPFRRGSKSHKVKGSGLGLTICQRIVELHNGNIEVDQDYCDGTRIKILLSKH